MEFEIREIKKHSIDTFDIWESIKCRIEGLNIKDKILLNSIIKDVIDEYLDLYGIDKNSVPEEDYNYLFNHIREEF